jgi:hypothetical protein
MQVPLCQYSCKHARLLANRHAYACEHVLCEKARMMNIYKHVGMFECKNVAGL